MEKPRVDGKFPRQPHSQNVIRGKKSDIGNVTTRVPQGPVLGPGLFLIYDIYSIGDEIDMNVRLSLRILHYTMK